MSERDEQGLQGMTLGERACWRCWPSRDCRSPRCAARPSSAERWPSTSCAWCSQGTTLSQHTEARRQWETTFTYQVWPMHSLLQLRKMP